MIMTTVYIKKNSDGSVELAGTVATDEMLEGGYQPYSGPLPERTNVIWLMWDGDKKEVVENIELRQQTELAAIRRQRDQLLAETDWVTTKAFESGAPADPQWIEYRQALRDMPNNYVVGQPIVWPTAPGALSTRVEYTLDDQPITVEQ